MATARRTIRKSRTNDSYWELIQGFPLVSIRSEEQLDEAQSVIDRLLAKPNLNSGEHTYLDALSDLVGAYEDEHFAIEAASDADMLEHLLRSHSVTQAQLSRETGIPKSTISEVLSGKKSFSRSMIRKLARYFHVDVSILASNI